MRKNSQNILWFREIDKNDIAYVGGKGANLGELVKENFPVPPGFVVTAKAYFDFLSLHKLDQKIKKSLDSLNSEDTKKLNEASREIKKSILVLKLPENLQNEIKKAYQTLYTKYNKGLFVAVRSSATAEDLPQASFAGQQITFLNVSSAEKLIEAVRACWASLFEPRAIYYRKANKFDKVKVGIAVVIQSMIQSEKAGVMFTIDPVSNNKDTIVVDAGYGLGETIVSGSITPDRYKINKKTMEIVEKDIAKQTWKISRDKETNKHLTISKDLQEKQKLSDEEILKIATIGKKIENHYGAPQDTEWAIDEHGQIFFVQSRPVTTLNKKINVFAPNKSEEKETSQYEVILKGAGASIGKASGPVIIIDGPKEIGKVKNGDILVAEMTNPSYVPAMKRAAAIITDAGGVTSHAAIVSRELGIPCVVGTSRATHVLRNSQIVTVDGAKGLVYKGKVQIKVEEKEKSISTKDIMDYRQEIPITATKVYVNLAQVHLAEDTAKLPCDGVGLLRAEFMIADMGEHPRAMVKNGKSQKYVHELAKGLHTICQQFSPRPVVYRASDFKTNEYCNLPGGAKYEPKEENPMIGYRGCFRYIKEPDLFKLEMEAIKIVREKNGLKNLWLMLPFIRTIDELKTVKELIESCGLERSSDFKLWMMVEVPSNVILIDEFIDVGIDGISIGTNDLTQLTLGIDRDSALLSEEFDERNEAVYRSVEKVIKSARAKGITSSVCGQAPSVYPEFTEFLINNGVTSVSVNPDAVVGTKRLISSIEKKILLNKIREGKH